MIVFNRTISSYLGVKVIQLTGWKGSKISTMNWKQLSKDSDESIRLSSPRFGMTVGSAAIHYTGIIDGWYAYGIHPTGIQYQRPALMIYF